ncbi:dTMP kinase [Gluconacetobacter entanii]|uniref:Thymidylate kinase n=1 Tax=Gluconacetobacter entanii TaxID=108528 RepID=A0ABT3K7Z0_9PROT|nr:dTMP kinase [Gluconacetobacter entanii]MBY4641262.1 dTMP kinase [Gluconacetobacter entanii]MCW4581973.1 dTMP kinase [Gluconacetobacter entanii]MCW4585285.1 dTMP kinase [Gluconacetobacter entanii]MCW4588862.1 dTMP kinase [Gluconacetobacter entanii]MCW4591559.1 dTMP kinase [Gluconacetobacter entanii]
MAGMFITFEGGEGAGKSTQVRLLQQHLATIVPSGRVVMTREPGGTPGAEAIRDLLLFGKHDLSLRAETLMHFSARYDHVDHLIRPALEAGKIVISDRFTDSTEAYQGYGRGAGDHDILALIASLRQQTGVVPDLTFILDIPRTVARERLRARGNRPDRYEAATEAFHARVAEGFAAIARHEPDRCITLDATLPPDILARVIAGHVTTRLPMPQEGT